MSTAFRGMHASMGDSPVICHTKGVAPQSFETLAIDALGDVFDPSGFSPTTAYLGLRQIEEELSRIRMSVQNHQSAATGMFRRLESRIDQINFSPAWHKERATFSVALRNTAPIYYPWSRWQDPSFVRPAAGVGTRQIVDIDAMVDILTLSRINCNSDFQSNSYTPAPYSKWPTLMSISLVSFRDEVVRLLLNIVVDLFAHYPRFRDLVKVYVVEWVYTQFTQVSALMGDFMKVFTSGRPRVSRATFMRLQAEKMLLLRQLHLSVIDPASGGVYLLSPCVARY
ncbi:hypothetical protein PLICRDRAFT_28795 [Plicaturopsis crispa FD-325 SS-3]|nr:hypothetical protein PLICRDRAFT_28795 [Plicaturopsis crispa FD-325 SS-3]